MTVTEADLGVAQMVTEERLGAPPAIDAVGWYSWAEEAAGILCARLAHAADKPKHHPCGKCRRAMRRHLRAEEAA